MNKKSLIHLTNKLYQITLLFPKKEPLRYKMREAADDILMGLTAPLDNRANSPAASLEVLNSFFEVAKSQNWVSPQIILNLQEEYGKVSQDTEAKKQEKVIELPQPEKTNVVRQDIPDNNRINGRQQIILDFLKENGRAQVGDLSGILPDVTKRTLRRDFKDLLGQGLIERIGQRNETYYRPAQIPTKL